MIKEYINECLLFKTDYSLIKIVGIFSWINIIQIILFFIKYWL